MGVHTTAPYRILISRSDQRPAADLYSVALTQPLPTVPIPLKPDDPESLVSLQCIFNGVYERERYHTRIAYDQTVPVVLQKQKRGKVRGPTPASLTSYVHALLVQMAAFFAQDHLAECALVLLLCFELPRFRGDDDRTRSGGRPFDDQSLGAEVRPRTG